MDDAPAPNGRISDKCNFREIDRARFARCGEHGSRVPWLQRQRPGRAGVRCSRLTLLRRDRGFAATSFAFALFGDAPRFDEALLN